MFYASFGTFMHRLIERFYRGEISKEEMSLQFLMGFSSEVKGDRPSPQIAENYLRAGLAYLDSFQPFPFNMAAVEKKITFDINGIPFVGFIDYLGEKDGELYIVDNKSRNLKPRSKRKTATKNDMEIDEMLTQLYLYSKGIYDEYGKFPKALCLNCFRNGTFITEEFNKTAYETALAWAEKSVNRALTAEEFYPSPDFFTCRYICGVSDECIYKP